jgi:dephospho-CoA kinase
MGKTACAQLLAQRTIPLIDTDELARRVVEPGQPALEEIRRSFGSQVFDPHGLLSRKALAQTVFSDATARKHLEAILHPRIRQLWQTQATAWRTESRSLGVVVIPLLFETNAQNEFDATICVACSASTQRARLLHRGWSETQIAQRLAAQFPIEQKLSLANFVIWSEGDMALHAEQLDRILTSWSNLAP